MPLSPGTRLGHDDVTSLIGEGAWARYIAPRPARFEREGYCDRLGERKGWQDAQ